MRFCTKGFTLVELLVVIAIMGLLVNLLIPSLVLARTSARIQICASNMRQQGVCINQYAADIKGFMMSPCGPHYLASYNSAPFPSACIVNVTAGSLTCSGGFGSPKVHAAGYGNFYKMEYITPPIAKVGKMGIMDCPEAPVTQGSVYTTDNGRTQMQAREFVYQQFSQYAKAMISDSGANPQGGNWDCVWDAQARIGYVYRGWWQNNVAYQKLMKAENWRTTNAIAIDNWGDHGDGRNILFFDGHVTFGDKNIGDLKSYIWYSEYVNGDASAETDGKSGPGYA